jgi:hypothetical protein
LLSALLAEEGVHIGDRGVGAHNVSRENLLFPVRRERHHPALLFRAREE